MAKNNTKGTAKKAPSKTAKAAKAPKKQAAGKKPAGGKKK